MRSLGLCLVGTHGVSSFRTKKSFFSLMSRSDEALLVFVHSCGIIARIVNCFLFGEVAMHPP